MARDTKNLQPEVIDLEDAYDRAIADIDGVWPLFEPSFNRMRRNDEFYRGEQWTAEEYEAFDQENRTPYVVDKISPKINHLLGVQRETRMDVKAQPREMGDEPQVALANRMIKWFEQINDIRFVESDVFKDGCLHGAGYAVVRMEMEDGMVYPQVARIPSTQVIWDGNCVEPDLSNARWVARVIPMTRGEAYEEFPQWAEHIQETSTWSPSAAFTRMFSTLTSRQESMGVSGRTNVRRELLQVVEYYERYRQAEYVVIDEIAEAEYRFDTYAEAETRREELVAGYMHGEVDTIDDYGCEKVSVLGFKKNVVTQTIIIGDRAVSHIITDLPDFPIVPFFAYFQDGEFWSCVDILIDPQVFVNKIFSEWDNQIARSGKQVMTVVEQMLKKGWDYTRVSEERSKTGATIPVNDHAALNMLAPQGASADIPNTLALMQTHMDESVGGRNSLGLQTSAAESGKAVMARAQAGGTGRLPLFDNLARWRKKVTEIAWWNMQRYLPQNQTLRVIGDRDDEVDVTLFKASPEQYESLRELRTDIVITDAPMSDLQREAEFQELVQLFGTMSGQIPPDLVMTTLLEFSSLPKHTKDKLLSKVASIQQYMQQQAEKERMDKIVRGVEDKMIRQEETRRQEQALARDMMQQGVAPGTGEGKQGGGAELHLEFPHTAEAHS